MTELHKALKAELIGHTATAGYLAGTVPAPDRFYPLVIPQKRRDGPQIMPAVVYALGNVDRGTTQCGTDVLIRSLCTLDCYSLKYDEAKDLAAAVRGVLLDFRGMLGAMIEVRAANLQSEFDLSDIEPGLYRVQQTWAIWHLE